MGLCGTGSRLEPVSVALEVLTNVSYRLDHSQQLMDMGLLEVPLLQMRWGWGETEGLLQAQWVRTWGQYIVKWQ